MGSSINYLRLTMMFWLNQQISVDTHHLLLLAAAARPEGCRSPDPALPAAAPAQRRQLAGCGQDAASPVA
ncbi:MAG: hypothetical protein ACK516_01300, partial [Cyanobium sp.]